MQQVVVAFVDNTDFASDGNECADKMQKIMNKHTDLFEATGRCAQCDDTACFSCQ